jgi:hypothetical protein
MRTKLYPNVPAITAGQPFQIRLPVPGPTIDGLLLRAHTTKVGPALADITNIRVVVDGNTLYDYATAAVLDELNQWHGRDAASGAGSSASPFLIPIYFRRPEVTSFGALSEIYAERATSLRTKGVKSAWVELTVASDWTAASVECYAEESPFVDEAPGQIVRVKRFNHPGAASGDQNILHDIPRGKGATGIIAVHFKDADVSNVTVEESGFAVVSRVRKAVLHELASQNGRSAQSGYTHLDFCHNGNLNEVLLVHPQRDLRGLITLDNSGAFDYYVEYLTDLADGM